MVGPLDQRPDWVSRPYSHRHPGAARGGHPRRGSRLGSGRHADRVGATAARHSNTVAAVHQEGDLLAHRCRPARYRDMGADQNHPPEVVGKPVPRNGTDQTRGRRPAWVTSGTTARADHRAQPRCRRRGAGSGRQRRLLARSARRRHRPGRAGTHRRNSRGAAGANHRDNRRRVPHPPRTTAGSHHRRSAAGGTHPAAPQLRVRP